MKKLEMRKLTQREKTLLMLVALIAVVAGFVMLGINPLQTANTQKRSEISALSGEEMKLKSVVTSEDSIRNTYQTQTLEAQRLRQTFPAKQKSYDIQRTITSVCSQAGVTISSLQIGEYSVATANGTALVAGTEALWQCTASLQLSGTVDQLIQVEDSFCHMSDNVAVSTCTITGLDNEITAQAAATTDPLTGQVVAPAQVEVKPSTASLQLVIFAIDEAPADAIATPAPTTPAATDELQTTTA